MKCNEVGKSKATIINNSRMNLDNLDKALQDLGMLSAITEARRDFLRDNTNYSVMRLNTRYVSNVTVGYCMRRTTTKNRLCPYVMPLRHRTKSENSDAMSVEGKDSSNETNSMFEPSTSLTSNCLEVPKSPAKRCQSLEYLNLSVEPVPTPEISPDMDCVSNRIQKLHVNE